MIFFIDATRTISLVDIWSHHCPLIYQGEQDLLRLLNSVCRQNTDEFGSFSEAIKRAGEFDWHKASITPPARNSELVRR